MTEADDRLSAIYEAVPADLPVPWRKDGRYGYSRTLLTEIIRVQLTGGSALKPRSGGLALAVDAWVATELRSAGIDADAVWPRASQPRALPYSFAKTAREFKFARSKEARTAEEKVIEKLAKGIGASRSEILGGLFFKEIDVVIAEIDKGLELGVSTKTMTGSAAKNIANRFEEAAGDLLNIRKRYPLATLGYVFLATANVPADEPAAWERIKDMCNKLRRLDSSDESASYDATSLIVIDWRAGGVQVREDLVPDDLAPDQFFEKCLRTLFTRSPVSEHPRARQLLASATE